MKTKGIFLGLCGMDVVFYSPCGLPKENSKLKTDCFLRQIGGPAANAAVTFARLGGEAVLYSYVGYDDTGLWLEKKLEKAGVKLVRINAGTPDGREQTDYPVSDISSIFVNLSEGTRTIISGQNIKDTRCFKASAEEFGTADFILYDGNLSGVETELMKYVDSVETELVLDAGSFKEKFPVCFSDRTTAIASENFRNPEGRDIFFYREQLKDCAMTRGEKSILYVPENSAERTADNFPMEIPVKKSGKVADTLAAGDIFHGAYCYFRYAEKLGFGEALGRASEVATESTEYIGTEEFFGISDM